MNADNAAPIATMLATGDESAAKLRELERELMDLLSELPTAVIGYPLNDPATCLELREAVQALRRAVDLIGQAVEREDPRYNAVADLIEEAERAAVN